MNIWGIQISQDLLSMIAIITVTTGAIVVPGYIIWKTKNRMKHHPFPERNTVDAVFHESKVSGRSHRSRLTKISNASNALEVIVTADELWVMLPDMFGWMAEQSDFDLRIPLSSITSAERLKGSVLIKTNHVESRTNAFELTLRDTDRFLLPIKMS